MTYTQIFALISVIGATALLYWTGYNGGLADGVEKGGNVERDANAKIIEELEESLRYMRVDLKFLAQRIRQLTDYQKLSPDNHQNLVAIAEKLKLAADTFRAVNSPTQATQALALRNKALTMAAQLQPVAQEQAA
jgi:hypothetical protein